MVDALPPAPTQNTNAQTQALGLRSSLPPGRQNGLSSILRTVQSLVHSALQDDDHLSQQQRGRKAAVLPAVEGFASTEVAVLLSGGVDSSVALSLLQKQVSGGVECLRVCTNQVHLLLSH